MEPRAACVARRGCGTVNDRIVDGTPCPTRGLDHGNQAGHRRAAHDPVADLSVTPRDGDLLVLRETSANGPCLVRTVPGPAHLLLPSYKKAVAYALRLAGRVPVDVWYTEDHMAFTAVRRARVHPTTS